MCSIYRSTVNSTVFCDFVKLLEYSLAKFNIDIKTEVVIVLDNASYHWSSKTVEWLRHHTISVEFLPPYCPNLAPVETLFKFIKSRFKKLWIGKTVNFYKPTTINIIKEACSQISEKTRHEAWISFIREGIQSIYNAESLRPS